MAGNLTERVRAARQPGNTVATQEQQVTQVRHVLDRMAPEFAKALPRHIPEHLFVRAGMTCVQQNPALLSCTAESLLGALLTCAQLGLLPGTKEAALVPFGKTVTLIPQWQGMVKMMYNSGGIESVVGEYIRDGDTWQYIPSRRPPDDWYHAPVPGSQEPITHAYAFAWLVNGGRSRIALLSEEDGIYIRNRFSRGWASAVQRGKQDEHPWSEKTDFWAMTRKSAIRRIFDWVPSSAAIRIYQGLADDDGEIRASHDVPPPRPAMLKKGDDSFSFREIQAPGTEQDQAPAQAAGKPGSDITAGQGPADITEGEFTDDEPRAQSTMNYADPAERGQMFAWFGEYFPGADRASILDLLSGFTGRQVKAIGDLTAADIADVITAFKAAGAGKDEKPETVRSRFEELCSMAAAAGTAPADNKHTEGKHHDE